MIFKDLERSGINYKVGILDNASSDDLSDLQEFYTGNNRISFYTNDKNVGFGTGHNILSQKNDSLYTLLLNPDLQFIEPSTIVRLLDNLKDNSGVVAVGPKLITYKGKSQWWDHGELEGLIASWLDGLGLSSWKDRTKAVSVAWVSGAVFLIKTKLFKDLGGFDENIFLYGEDVELCYRIRQHGRTIFYDPSIKVKHKGQVGSRRSKYVWKSQEYILDKHYKHNKFYSLFKAILKLINSK